MKITTEFTLGRAKYTMETEEKDDMDTLHKAIVLSNPRRKCNNCNEINKIYLTSNKDREGNIYINVKCACGAKSKLGRYKTGGYFWHEFELYNPNKKK